MREGGAEAAVARQQQQLQLPRRPLQKQGQLLPPPQQLLQL